MSTCDRLSPGGGDGRALSVGASADAAARETERALDLPTYRAVMAYPTATISVELNTARLLERTRVKGGAKSDHRGGGKLDHPAVEWRG